MKKWIFLSVIVISLLTLSGCLNYTEETWLNENGSGRLTMEIGISEGLANMMAKNGNEDPFSDEKISKSFKNNKDIKVISTKAYNKNGNRVVKMVLEFKSFKSLETAMNSDNQSGNPGFIGHMTMTNDKKGRIIFNRVLAFNTSASPGKKSNDEFSAMGEEMMNSLLSNYVWKYTIHFPTKVISANTADEYINRKTNTVTWDFTLISLTKKPQTMRAILRPYNFFEAILHKLNLYN